MPKCIVWIVIRISFAQRETGAADRLSEIPRRGDALLAASRTEMTCQAAKQLR